MNQRSSPTWETFPAETLDALANAVEIDDVFDRHVSLPEPIVLACNQEQMRSCFALCWQFWNSEVVRSELSELIKALVRERDLAPPDRLRYKRIRAAYKELRAALILYTAGHREPLLFRTTVRVMGRMQDAFRYGRRPAVRAYGLLLRLLLSAPVWKIARRPAGRVDIDTPKGFLAYREQEVRQLEQLLAREQFSGGEFHAMRKIVSRHVAFYGTLRTLRPDGTAYKTWRYLSAINGLMGARHDELVQQAVSGRHHYRVATPLPHEIRWRLEAFVKSYRLN